MQKVTEYELSHTSREMPRMFRFLYVITHQRHCSDAQIKVYTYQLNQLLLTMESNPMSLASDP